MFWNSGPVLKQCQGAYLCNGIHLLQDTPEWKSYLRVCASALVEVMKGMMDRIYMVVHHYKTPGAYQPLREQYKEIGRRLSHVYCWILNGGEEHHLSCLYRKSVKWKSVKWAPMLAAYFPPSVCASGHTRRTSAGRQEGVLLQHPPVHRMRVDDFDGRNHPVLQQAYPRTRPGVQ